MKGHHRIGVLELPNVEWKDMMTKEYFADAHMFGEEGQRFAKNRPACGDIAKGSQSVEHGDESSGDDTVLSMRPIKSPPSQVMVFLFHTHSSYFLSTRITYLNMLNSINIDPPQNTPTPSQSPTHQVPSYSSQSFSHRSTPRMELWSLVYGAIVLNVVPPFSFSSMAKREGSNLMVLLTTLIETSLRGKIGALRTRLITSGVEKRNSERDLGFDDDKRSIVVDGGLQRWLTMAFSGASFGFGDVLRWV
ncbi:uncharacterized protein G2W53_011764 [Senna tora]|uniref:Uncharacterized protein n=1 Tax=Senna tora TaxID=362788 RepID=A0A834X3C3_9FABA|nr:uncharacterized protein G2W53_011764 [Senna tora]